MIVCDDEAIGRNEKARARTHGGRAFSVLAFLASLPAVRIGDGEGCPGDLQHARLTHPRLHIDLHHRGGDLRKNVGEAEGCALRRGEGEAGGTGGGREATREARHRACVGRGPVDDAAGGRCGGEGQASDGPQHEFLALHHRRVLRSSRRAASARQALSYRAADRFTNAATG